MNLEEKPAAACEASFFEGVPELKAKSQALVISPVLNQEMTSDYLLNVVPSKEEMQKLESLIQGYLLSHQADFLRVNEAVTR